MSWVLLTAWAAWWLCNFQLVTSPIFLISTMGTMTGKNEGYGRCLRLGSPVVDPETRILVKVKKGFIILSCHMISCFITSLL